MQTVSQRETSSSYWWGDNRKFKVCVGGDRGGVIKQALEMFESDQWDAIDAS